VPSYIHAGHAVHEDWDVKLSQSSIVDGASVNKFYIIQVLRYHHNPHLSL
jgi:hypothetical protein